MKKFVITKDEEVATKLLACGFIKVSENAGIWTFQNVPPKNFSFEEFDKKIAFTNMLSI